MSLQSWLWAVALLPGLFRGAGLESRQRGDSTGFDHSRHATLFPLCTSCHAGARSFAQSLWPAGESCAACHDGVIQQRVGWAPPAIAKPGNLRFTHERHAQGVAETTRGDSALACQACHIPSGASWMVVRRTINQQCRSCHGIQSAHLEAPDSACATCHVSLAQSSLTRDQVVAMKQPASHAVTGFSSSGHGLLAQPHHSGARGSAVAASCSTCHARDFCITCHVNAPETATIQALAPDPRSRAVDTRLEAPGTHSAEDFLERHGTAARQAPLACQTCHTRESCSSCHAGQVKAVREMYAAGPGRATGAPIIRRPPSSHTVYWATQHSTTALARPQTCSACHARSQCLECHRPDPARGRGYHQAGFLTRHPAAAYAREANCSDCHNGRQFCTSCHQQSGMVSSGPMNPGFHDGKTAFIAGHGVAARQSLESCVSCHAERDCLQCHSALGGQRFNPHGPGFDAARLKKRNPQMCTACHGNNIPG